MHELTTERVLDQLAAQLRYRLRFRIADPSRADRGALVNPYTGLVEANASVAAPIFGAAVLHLAGDEGFEGEPWPVHAMPITETLIAGQRESGSTDLLECNIDAEPDTAFIMLQFCAAEELARQRPDRAADPAYQALQGRIEHFARRAVPGITRGGFHTPNHRWVLAAALTWAGVLWPQYQPEAEAAAGPLLAEGYDIDADGFFIERSSGCYDGVVVRCLWLLWRLRGDAAARAAALANLEMNLHMLHGDGTIETAHSTRQDRGERLVPTRLAEGYLQAAHDEQDAARRGRWLAAARHLWAAGRPSLGEAAWMAFTLLRRGSADAASSAPPAAPPAGLPDRFSRYFATQRIARRREGLASITVMAQCPLLTFRYGEAAVVGLHIRHSYFGAAGDFLPSDMQPIAGEDGEGGQIGGVRLEATGREGDPRRPAYELALGRPVPHEQWQAALAQRQQRPMPPAKARLEVRWVDGGMELIFQSDTAPPGVLVQLAFDFAPGGVWRSASQAFEPRPGQVLHLRSGAGRMVYGPDWIELVGGAADHDSFTLRDGTTWPGGPRAVVNLRCPARHVVRLGGGRGH